MDYIAMIEKEDDPAKLRKFIKNAERNNRQDMVEMARIKIVELIALSSADDPSDPVVKAGWACIAAREEQLRIKHGRRVLASYARRGIKNHGMLAEIAYAVNRKDIADGGRELLEAGLANYTFEQVVLDFPDRFEPEVVAAAKARLA